MSDAHESCLVDRKGAKMEIDVEIVGQVTVVSLNGRLDSKGAHIVREQILPLTQQDCRILLNMDGVHYMSSAGLRVLLLIYRRIEEIAGAIIITGLSDRIRDVIEMTGFLDFFTTCDTIEEGLEALSTY